MSTIKESTDDQDPDYISSVATDEKQQKIHEENARSNTARRITAIVEKEFSQEIDTKEKEVLQIQERLHKALKTLHLLRYVIITDFYNRKQCQAPQIGEAKQTRIHPAIKQLIGKAPAHTIRDTGASAERFSDDYNNSSPSTSKEDRSSKIKDNAQEDRKAHAELHAEKRSSENDNPRPIKIPRYVPPRSGVPDPPCPSRGIRHKVRKRIIVGNISKWIPPDWREDAASHKWTMYVRGSKEDADIDDFVSKVRFFLHPSYRPNDVVEVTSAPFHLSRRGWGEFPLRVQLHFKNPLNKPMDIIHHLKLDRTYTGLQTLGSETLVDIWIHTTEPRASLKNAIEFDTAEKPSDKDPSTEANFEYNELPKSSDVIRKENDDSDIIGESTDSNTPVPDTSCIVDKWDDKHLRSAPAKSEFSTDELAFNGGAFPNIQQIKFYVKLDHDYLKSEFEERIAVLTERNITIDHSLETKCSPSLTLWDDETIQGPSITKESDSIGNLRNKHLNNCDAATPMVLGISERSDCTTDHMSDEKDGNKNDIDTSVNLNCKSNARNNCSEPSRVKLNFERDLMENGLLRASTKDWIEVPETPMSQRTNATTEFNNRTSETQGSVMPVSGLKSNLIPLQISIPPSFPSRTGKHVLVLKNNKIIPVGIGNTSTSKREQTNAGNAVNINCTKPTGGVSMVSRGISLLKKSHMQSARTGEGTGKPLLNNEVSSSKIRPTASLLFNANYHIPALKIADGHVAANLKGDGAVPAQSIKVPCTLKDRSKGFPVPEIQEEKVTRNRVTLGKDRYKIQSKKDLYEEALQTIDTAQIADTEALIRFIVRRLPIITPCASDPDYRRLHPYACSSEKQFFGQNIGKQRAHEWYRARTVRQFLQKKALPEGQLWTVKEIMIWARLHGYTPVSTSFGVETKSAAAGAEKLPSSSASTIISTTTEPIELQKWLEACDEKSRNLVSSVDPFPDEEIDVVFAEQRESIDAPAQSEGLLRTGSKRSNSVSSTRMIPLELDEKLVPLHDFVCETARDIGIRLAPEEISPNVMHCAAGRAIIRAMECLVEDIARSSLARAWERNGSNGCPRIITLDDVRSAIASREEFDVFTNEGLGSRQHLLPGD